MARQQNIRIGLNLNIRGLKKPATLAINEKSRELQQQGRKVYRLGFGQSPFSVPEPVAENLGQHAGSDTTDRKMAAGWFKVSGGARLLLLPQLNRQWPGLWCQPNVLSLKLQW